MSTVCIFFIGSGHGSDEDLNVLVALNRDCRLGDLGIEGNHGAGKISRLSKRAKEATERNWSGDEDTHYRNGGWHWINEGQDSLGTGLNQQAVANVNRIAKIRDKHDVSKVVLVGHSRGAVCAMMVAHKLQTKYGDAAPPCHLFLYDPVKRSAIGMGNTIIGANVKSLRVLVAEDNADQLIFTSGKDMFTPTLPRVDGGTDPNYVRIPGTHGTMTQVNGMPIGRLGHMLALEWLNRKEINVPMANATPLTLHAFCEAYDKIVELNPISRSANGTRMREITDMGKVKTGQALETKFVPLGGGTVTREHHELGWQGTERTSLTRSGYLDSQGIMNRLQGDAFFVNEDHRNRFKFAYPMCSELVRHRGANGTRNSAQLQRELEVMGSRYSPMEKRFRATFQPLLG